MKKTGLLLSALLISLTPAMAQDAKAKAILDASSKKMSGYKSLKADFAWRFVGKDGKVQQSQNGTLQMKGDKFHITTPEQEMISDGKSVWTFLKTANEVQITQNTKSDETLTPTKLFSNFYEKNYSYKYVGSKKIAGKNCDIVELQPTTTSKAKQFSKVELAIDPNKQIAGGTVIEKGGSQIQYEVKNVVPNAAIPDAAFTFDVKAHKGVEVVDLR